MEIWKDIEGYEGLYEVSQNGKIKSLAKEHRYGSKKDRILKPRIKKNGYAHINLCKNGKIKSTSLHRIVAKAFIVNSKNKPTVNHIDGNKLNNKISNLEWATMLEQNLHKLRLC